VEPKEIEAGTFATPLALKSYGASSRARISIHSFNTKEEIDQLVHVLQEMM